MTSFPQILGARRHQHELVQSARRHSCHLVLSERRPSFPLVTAFTTSPTGRVFNSRFSDRFKKS